MNDRPWMTALEMQFTALAIFRKIASLPDAPRSCTDAHVEQCLHSALPFDWSREASSAAWLASKTIPDDASFSRDLLPDGLRAAWWWLNWPLPLPMKHQKKRDDDFSDIDENNICALLLSVDGEGVWTVSCGRMSTLDAASRVHAPYMIEVNQIPSGTRLKDLSHPETRTYDSELKTVAPVRPRDLALFRFVLAASAWLKQRIAVSSSGHVERHRRKQLARDYGAHIADVKIIVLRRAAQDTNDESPIPAAIEYERESRGQVDESH